MDLEGAVDSAETRNQDDANVRDQVSGCECFLRLSA